VDSPRVGIYNELEVRGRTSEIEQRTINDVLEQVVAADRLGYTSAWFVEHHFTRGFSHSSAPDILLAAIARETTQIRLGLGVVLLPFAHPIRTAERVATLDVVSGGRVELGTGRGASPLEYQAFKRPFELSRTLWEQNLEAVLAIFEADGDPVPPSAATEHEFWSVPEVSVLPRPVQKPHPPIWVASTSLDGFLAAAAKGYDLLCMPILKGIDDLQEDLDAYRRCLAEHDFDPAERRIGMLVPWYVGETREQAHADAADAVLWYIRRQVNLVTPPDYTDARHATYRVLGQLAAGMPPDEALETLRDHHMVVIDDVGGSQKAFARFAEAGITDLLCQFQVGGLAHDLVMSSMERFMVEVAQP
jgi:alkanesulfonate monooxygenase SsuD/methylene tetrahydromethanopterin reductase-like flavin-dependent oxidoreductase (luciferase family)